MPDERPRLIDLGRNRSITPKHSDLAFRKDKTNKGWEIPADARQQRAGGMKATTSPHSEPTTCNTTHETTKPKIKDLQND